MKWSLFHRHVFLSERNVDGHFGIATCPCFDFLISSVRFGGLFAFKWCCFLKAFFFSFKCTSTLKLLYRDLEDLKI